MTPLPEPSDDLIAARGFKAFPPKRPGLNQSDVDAMRARHNLAADITPGDDDHTDLADMADQLDISHLAGGAWAWVYFHQ